MNLGPVPLRWCAIDSGIVGAGWALNDPPDIGPLPDGCDDLDLYLKHAKMVFPNDNSLEGVADAFELRLSLWRD